MTHIISDSSDKKSLLLKGRTAHCPLWNPSGRVGPSNQAAVFQWERREGTKLNLYPRDPSVGFRGQMRCKSIKKEFVSQSQTRWEPLPCHSGAANFPYGSRSLMQSLNREAWKKIRPLQMIIEIRQWQRLNPFRKHRLKVMWRQHSLQYVHLLMFYWRINIAYTLATSYVTFVFVLRIIYLVWPNM